MPKTQNSTVFNGEADDFYDPNYDINNKMKIPKTLTLGENYGDDISPNEINWGQDIPNNLHDMHMPDRILVVGHDQHIGLKAPPLEMTLENPGTPPEYEFTRVQTPPRVITLGDHYFPSIDDESIDDYPNNSITINSSSPVANGPFVNDTQIAKRIVREPTPVWNNTLDVSLAPSDEIQHLRRQVGKLNRRVMAVELEMLQRQQRDKIFYAITIAYFFFKTFNWLTKN